MRLQLSVCRTYLRHLEGPCSRCFPSTRHRSPFDAQISPERKALACMPSHRSQFSSSLALWRAYHHKQSLAQLPLFTVAVSVIGIFKSECRWWVSLESRDFQLKRIRWESAQPLSHTAQSFFTYSGSRRRWLGSEMFELMVVLRRCLSLA